MEVSPEDRIAAHALMLRNHGDDWKSLLTGDEDQHEFVQAFARHRTEALSGSRGEGWQDIASAPKDGTWFIADQDGELYPCQWERSEPDEGAPHEGWFDLFNRSFEAPTCWHPTPALSEPRPSAASEVSLKDARLVLLEPLLDDVPDNWRAQGYRDEAEEIADMANVGRSLIEAIADAKYAGSPIEHWVPADSPAEIVTDLLNMLIDATPKASEMSGSREAIEVALDLARRVRDMTRAENIHARGMKRAQRGGHENLETSRDDTDMIHANLYTAWPAKRLDALIAALSTPPAASVASEVVERLRARYELALRNIEAGVTQRLREFEGSARGDAFSLSLAIIQHQRAALSSIDGEGA